MGIGRRIKESRISNGFTQEELAKLLGVTKGAVANYEKETSHPKEPIMYKLIEVLNVDANYLFQDVVNIPNEKNDVSLSEYEHIKKYRTLDEYGKEAVDSILGIEYRRVESERTSEQLHVIKQAARNGEFIEEVLTDSEKDQRVKEIRSGSLVDDL